MGLPFTNAEYNWILDRLADLQELLTPEAQRAFVGKAFHDSPRKSRIATSLHYSKSPRDFVLDALRYFGEQVQEDIPGRKTVGVFLREALDCLDGGPDAEKLRDIITRYYPGALSPPPTSPLAISPAPSSVAVVATSPLEARLIALSDQLADMQQDQRADVNMLLWAISQTNTTARESGESMREIQAWASRALADTHQISAELRSKLEALVSHTANAKQYLEVSLPIIPNILTYKYELSTQHALDLGQVWERVRKRLRKGEDGEKGPRSAPHRAVVNSGDARGVFVGVGRYDDDGFSTLAYPARDLTALAGLLAPRYRAAPLLGDEAEPAPSRSNILRELIAQAAAVEAGDLFLFAFSGHGVVRAGKSYLIARDTAEIATEDTGISLESVRALMVGSKARAKVLILDACHAGAQIGKGSEPMSPEFMQRVFTEAQGICVLSSSLQSQTSWESRDFCHGVFTYYLLEALSGRADWEGKGFVTVSDVHRYVSGMVKGWAAENHKIQSPTLQCEMDGEIVLHRYA